MLFSNRPRLETGKSREPRHLLVSVRVSIRRPRCRRWGTNQAVQNRDARVQCRERLGEAAYVGNRGAWFIANNLIDLNALTAQRTPKLEGIINQASGGGELVAFTPASSPSGEDGLIAIFKGKAQ